MAGDNQSDDPQSVAAEAAVSFGSLNFVDLLKHAERTKPGDSTKDLLTSLAFNDQAFSIKHGTGFLNNPINLEVNKSAFLSKPAPQIAAMARLDGRALI